ncbi:hypothetical protein ACOMHN_025484 [Nucella lapillus]
MRCVKPQVLAGYFRVSANPPKESLIQFESSVRRAAATNEVQLLIGGDLNFPDWDWSTMTLKPSSSHPDLHRRFIDFLHDVGLEQVVIEPTRLENTLDLVMTNCPSLIPRVEILPGLSDHEVVYVEYNTKVSLSNCGSRPIPLYNKADWASMKKEMAELQSEMDALASNDSTSAEDLWDKFKITIQSSITRNIPHKTPRKTDSYPWITTEVRRLLRERDRAYRKMKKHGTEELKTEVRRLRREVQQKLRRAYWDYVNRLFTPQEEEQDRTPCTKRFWTYIKHQRTSQSGVPPLKVQGRLVTDSKAKAEALNSQFFTAFSEGKQYKSTEVREKCSMPGSREDFPTMPVFSITPPGVEKLLANLNPAKAAGPDNISPRVLKTLASEVSPLLTSIFQRSLSTGCVPEDWRTAHVTPVYKKGEHYKASNYRPISLTSVPCKIMEHVIVSNVMGHLESSNILTPHQHGFRKKHSCETQLLELSDQLTSNLDKGLPTDIVVLDFAKAFDKVNHSLLTHKLDHYGVRGDTNRWICNFLRDRKQAVVVEGSRSEFVQVKSGVPQGSVLGPCLFLAYINDLPSHVSSNARLFADDTAIDRPIRSDTDRRTLQEDLDALSEWETQWDMEFHPDKCSVLTVQRSRKPTPEVAYTLHGQQLEHVSSTKYLGVTIQSDGKWDQHITSIANKANRTLGFLRRNLKIGSRRIKQMAYKVLVRPVLEYSACVWDPHDQNDCESLEKVQRRAARFALNRHRRTSSVEQMMHELKWTHLEQRRRTARLCMLYKIMNELVCVRCKQLAPAVTRSRRCHNKQLMRIPAKNEYRNIAFFPRTVRDWNGLPADAVLSPSLGTFSSKVSSPH